MEDFMEAKTTESEIKSIIKHLQRHETKQVKVERGYYSSSSYRTETIGYGPLHPNAWLKDEKTFGVSNIEMSEEEVVQITSRVKTALRSGSLSKERAKALSKDQITAYFHSNALMPALRLGITYNQIMALSTDRLRHLKKYYILRITKKIGKNVIRV